MKTRGLLRILWSVTIVFNLGLLWTPCSGLQCWKCIGKTCDEDPSEDYRASRMTCRDGEACMKVYFRQTENGSSIVLESTTRSCSAGRCLTTSVQAFDKCLNNPRQYKVLGCALRSCCDERDLCNNAHTVTAQTATILAMVITVLTCMRGELADLL